jgi:hypothetical protein
VPLVVLFALLVRLDWRRATWSQDEADLASAAVAMTARAAAWLRPDYHPFVAHAHERLGGGLVAPPLAPGLMALPGLIGLRASWGWTLAGTALLFAGIASLVRAFTRARWSAVAAAVAVVVAIAPRLAIDLLTLEAEVPLAGLGAMALALAWRGAPEGRVRGRAFASGALLGAAFLCKLWLVAPIALATLAVWAHRRDESRASVIVAFVAGGLSIASAHLVLVAVLDPASLGRWLREVYGAAFGTGGVGSTKWAGVTKHPEWRHGAWYYPVAIARELGLASPLALIGGHRLLFRAPSSRHRARAGAVGLGLGVLALSVPVIKEPLYVLTVVAVGAAVAAFVVVLAARCARARPVLGALLLAGVVVAIAWPRPAAFRDRRQPEQRLEEGRTS